MKKALTFSFSFVGTVIGAGFATGREILLFFGDCSLLSVIFSGFFLGLFCFIILRLSSSFGSIFRSFGFLEKPIRVFIVLANFCVLCATISGAESVLSQVFSIRGGGVLTAFLCLSVVLLGLRGVHSINLVAVPVILLLVFVVFFKSDTSFLPLTGKISIVKPFNYAAMNLVSGGFLLGASSRSPTKKESVLCALVSGITLTVMLVLIRLSVQGVSAEMPFLAKADSLGLTFIGYLVLYLAMVTTVIGTTTVCSCGKKPVAVFFIFAAIIISTFGFQTIVDAAYPILGAVGGAITVCSLVIYLLSLSPKFSRYYTLLFRPNDSLFRRRSPREN